MVTLSKPVCVLAPAKVNLFLSVEGKRSDGYHDLCTVMCAVSLYDLLIFSFQKESSILVTCNHSLVPNDKSNLVYMAISLFFKQMRGIGLYNNLGVSVCIEKKIPVGAGFGGGSSDAASTLLLLNSRFGFPFSVRSLMSMGRKLGADVPFFIFRKPVVARGIGDCFDIFTQKLPKFALLVYTGLVVSTGWVYENLCLNQNLRLTKDKKKISKFHLSVGGFDCRCHLLNDLESVSEVRFPVIAEVKAFLLELGAISVLMSGSGSGVFGLFDDGESATLALRTLRQHERSVAWSSYMVDLLF